MLSINFSVSTLLAGPQVCLGHTNLITGFRFPHAPFYSRPHALSACADWITCLSPFVAVLKLLPDSQSIVGSFARLICQCHAKTRISPVATWGQGSSGLEHHLGRWIVDLMRHLLDNLADSSDGRDKKGFMNTWHRPLWLTACRQGLTKPCALLDFAYFLGPETAY